MTTTQRLRSSLRSAWFRTRSCTMSSIDPSKVYTRKQPVKVLVEGRSCNVRKIMCGNSSVNSRLTLLLKINYEAWSICAESSTLMCYDMIMWLYYNNDNKA